MNICRPSKELPKYGNRNTVHFAPFESFPYAFPEGSSGPGGRRWGGNGEAPSGAAAFAMDKAN
ncbi:hypothetical protein GCM10010446_39540 [Streptomyces enissocaesilis]|uniref:Uncharacterized protein n=1 Tax=Streptomyces enissocaesilis TaxID=332589 RepID=A0ABN3XDF0_9ACTN